MSHTKANALKRMACGRVEGDFVQITKQGLEETEIEVREQTQSLLEIVYPLVALERYRQR